MRVGIYETVEVSDEQRTLIAADLGKKAATRNDLKAWIWDKGANWADAIGVGLNASDPDEEPDEDLLGDADFGGGTTEGGPDEAPEDENDEDLLGGSDEDGDEDLI